MTNTPALDKWRKEQGRRNRPPKPLVETAPEPLGNIYARRQFREARPGSQRRCYDGCFPSSDWEIFWSDWEPLFSSVSEKTLAGWPDFQRDGLRTEYRWEPLGN